MTKPPEYHARQEEKFNRLLTSSVLNVHSAAVSDPVELVGREHDGEAVSGRWTTTLVANRACGA